MPLKRYVVRLFALVPGVKARRRASGAKRYREQVELARQAKDVDRLEELRWQKQQDEIDEYEWEEIQFTKRLVGRAHRLKVEVPDRPPRWEAESEHWSVSQIHGEWYLTQKGITVVREAVRAEEKWLRDQRAQYLAWAAPIIGFVGALTGLIAVLTRNR